MRSKTARARKAWRLANTRASARGYYKESVNRNTNFSIPPRYKLLQKIAGHYDCKVKRGESPVAFDISVDPRRILRIGDSRHFESCLNFKTGLNKQYIPTYLKNRYCCPAGVINANTGEWLSRVMLHVCLRTDQTPNREVLVMETIYGNNFPLEHLVQEMFERHGLEVYISTDADFPDEYDWSTLDEVDNYTSKFHTDKLVYLRALTSAHGYYFQPEQVNSPCYYDKDGFLRQTKTKEGYYVQARRLTYIKIEKL